MTWLITGGAGYIGAHVVGAMAAAGEPAVVLDDLSTGEKGRLPDGVELVIGSVLDVHGLAAAMRGHGVTGVIHFAAKKQVGESVARPLHYYRENLDGLRSVLEACVETGVRRFVFSSSAAVYGMPDVELVTEETPCSPLNPYGETKLAGEWLVRAAAHAHGIAYANLRYFNVAGAGAPELADQGVYNLVPMVFERLSAGDAPRIFGDDYATPDGTCVRDYVHVVDVAGAHLAAARRVSEDPSTALTLNAGRGIGTSVREMLDIVADVTGFIEPAPVVFERRPGDPASVVAATDRIRRELGWSAKLDVRAMVTSAWDGWRLRRH